MPDSNGGLKKVIELRSPVAVKDLAVLLGHKPIRIVAELLDFQVMAGVDQPITFEIAAKVAKRYGFDATRIG